MGGASRDLKDGSGRNSEAADGNFMRHESFRFARDRPGLLGMCNHGKDTNGSQFYVTARPLPFLDGKFVVFGRVISGMRTILQAAKVRTVNERPSVDIRVTVDLESIVFGSVQAREEKKMEDA